MYFFFYYVPMNQNNLATSFKCFYVREDSFIMYVVWSLDCFLQCTWGLFSFHLPNQDKNPKRLSKWSKTFVEKSKIHMRCLQSELTYFTEYTLHECIKNSVIFQTDRH